MRPDHTTNASVPAIGRPITYSGSNVNITVSPRLRFYTTMRGSSECDSTSSRMALLWFTDWSRCVEYNSERRIIMRSGLIVRSREDEVQNERTRDGREGSEASRDAGSPRGLGRRGTHARHSHRFVQNGTIGSRQLGRSALTA